MSRRDDILELSAGKKTRITNLFIIDSKNQINTILPSFAHFRKGYISHHDQANPISYTALIITNTEDNRLIKYSEKKRINTKEFCKDPKNSIKSFRFILPQNYIYN